MLIIKLQHIYLYLKQLHTFDMKRLNFLIETCLVHPMLIKAHGTVGEIHYFILSENFI